MIPYLYVIYHIRTDLNSFIHFLSYSKSYLTSRRHILSYTQTIIVLSRLYVLALDWTLKFEILNTGAEQVLLSRDAFPIAIQLVLLVVCSASGRHYNRQYSTRVTGSQVVLEI